MREPESRTITLRNERKGRDQRHLWAYLDADGILHIDGQDLGPATAIGSGDGEYEWFKTIAAKDIPRLVKLLGGQRGEEVLDLLERDWTSPHKADELEDRLRESKIRVKLSVWSD